MVSKMLMRGDLNEILGPGPSPSYFAATTSCPAQGRA
jgi:hypothetical protein